MSKFLYIGLGLLVGGALLWYYQSQRRSASDASGPRTVTAQVPSPLNEADRKALTTYHAQLRRYFESDLMHRYATLTFDLASNARDELLSRYADVDRKMPSSPFSLNELQGRMEGINLFLEETLRAQGQIVESRSHTDLKSSVERGLARQAHLAALEAIKPHLRKAEDEATWERMRAEAPKILV